MLERRRSPCGCLAGTVLGASNGDARSHVVETAPWRPAYHGLVRAVVRVTSTAARSDLALLQAVDAVLHNPATNDIVVEASCALGVANITIPVSLDADADGVLAVAAAGAGKSVDFGF